MQKLKHNYNDSIFRRLFHDKEKILELYNALSGENYPLDTDIQIVTLDDAIFGDRKNDLAFIINGRLIILLEHQSTINPNMPLRMLVYMAKEYERLYFSKAVYSKQLVRIPTPELYVFYNGKEEAPLEQELKLSDAFIKKCDKLSLQAVVKVINVNYEKGAEILNRCQTLSQYSQFIHMVRESWKAIGDLETAIKVTIEVCIEKGMLRDFLKEKGGDLVSFLFEALTREECEEIRENDGYQKGLAEGGEKGERNKAIAVIRNLLQQNMPDKEICALVECDQELIDEVRNSLEEK